MLTNTPINNLLMQGDHKGVMFAIPLGGDSCISVNIEYSGTITTTWCTIAQHKIKLDNINFLKGLSAPVKVEGMASGSGGGEGEVRAKEACDAAVKMALVAQAEYEEERAQEACDVAEKLVEIARTGYIAASNKTGTLLATRERLSWLDDIGKKADVWRVALLSYLEAKEAYRTAISASKVIKREAENSRELLSTIDISPEMIEKEKTLKAEEEKARDVYKRAERAANDARAIYVTNSVNIDVAIATGSSRTRILEIMNKKFNAWKAAVESLCQAEWNYTAAKYASAAYYKPGCITPAIAMRVVHAEKTDAHSKLEEEVQAEADVAMKWSKEHKRAAEEGLEIKGGKEKVQIPTVHDECLGDQRRSNLIFILESYVYGDARDPLLSIRDKAVGGLYSKLHWKTEEAARRHLVGDLTSVGLLRLAERANKREFDH